MYGNLTLSGYHFEFRTMVELMQLKDDKWNGLIWSRHGGEQYSKWWFDNFYQARLNQLDDFDNIQHFHTFILAFVKIQNPDLDKLRNEFLRNIGGQTRVKCGDHEFRGLFLFS